MLFFSSLTFFRSSMNFSPSDSRSEAVVAWPRSSAIFECVLLVLEVIK